MSRIEPLQNLMVGLIFQKTPHQKASVIPQSRGVFARLHSFAAPEADLRLDSQAEFARAVDFWRTLDARPAARPSPRAKADRTADSGGEFPGRHDFQLLLLFQAPNQLIRI